MSFPLTPTEFNCTATALTSGSTWTGEWERVAPYNTVTCAVKTDQAGTLYMEFSPDGVNADSSLSYDVSASMNEVHRLTVTRLYYRARFTNSSGSNQTYFRLQSLFGDQPLLTSTLTSSIQNDNDAIVTRSVLLGQNDGGQYKNVKLDAYGHLETTIHGRNLIGFGSVHTENLTPIFQTDFVYGLNSGQVNTGVTGTGSVSSVESTATISTGTTIYSSGFIQSRKRLRYRAGQGVIGRFTASFTTGVANSYQVCGFGHAEDYLVFGYQGTSFGIIYGHHGAREIRTLTVTNAATGAGNVTVTLNGTAYTIAVSASAVGNIARTVYELAIGVYSSWKVQPNGSGAEVQFVADAVGSKSGTYSVSGSGVVGTFAQVRAGASATESFTASSSWNIDPLDGNGPSGFTIDPSKLNVYQINIQYLGTGCITFLVEAFDDGGNDATFTPVHIIQLPSTLTKTSMSNPAFPFLLSAYSAGSTTDLTVKCGSFAGFIEGQKKLHGNRFSYFNSTTNANSSSYTCLFTIFNSRIHVDRANQSVVNILSINAAVKHTQPVVFYLIKNATLSGNPSFSHYAEDISCTLVDTSSTTCTFASNEQLIWTGHLGETGQIDHSFSEGGPDELTLQPGEYMTLAVRSVQNNVAWATGSINTREDQ